MKKIKKALFYTILCILVLTVQKGSAWYNETGTNIHSKTGGGNSKCGSHDFCQYDNVKETNAAALKIQLFYIDNGNYNPIGVPKYVYFTSDMRKKLINYGVGENELMGISGYKVGALKFRDASNALKDYFGDTKENVNNILNGNLKNYFVSMCGAGDMSCYTNDTENSDPTEANVAKKGYRVVIEPVVFYKSKSARYIITPKEAAYLYISKSNTFDSCSFPLTLKQYSSCKSKMISDETGKIASQAGLLYTGWNDVGIRAGSRTNGGVCDNITVGELSDVTNGCGMNIIDVGKFIETRKCYKQRVEGNVECIGKDYENTGNFQEYYDEVKCDTLSADEKTNSIYGKKVDEQNKCVLYATESGYVTLPGGISKTNSTYNISEPAYFAWPKRVADKGPHAQIRDIVEFRIVNEGGSGPCSATDIDKLVKTAKTKVSGATFQLTLTGGDFNAITGENLRPANPQLNINENVTVGDFNGNVSKSFTYYHFTYMEIDEIRNRIYNKTKNTVRDGKTITSLDEFDRGEGVISLAVHNNKAGETKKYELKLPKLRFGIDGGVFKVSDYKCEVETTRNHCTCPTEYKGKHYLGKNIDEYINNGATCEQAQIQAIADGYCGQVCTTPAGNKIDITECMISEMNKNKDLTEDQAYNICEAAEPRCRKSCQTEDGNYIPLTQYEACVKNEQTKNKLIETEAVEKCDNLLCGCMVNGAIPDAYVNCVERGGSRKVCTAMYCDKQNVCKQCMHCTTGCNWTEKKIDSSQTAYIKTCDNGYPGEADCSHHIVNNKSCVQNELGVTDIVTALQNGTITVSDLEDAIFACSNTTTTQNDVTGKDNVVFRIISLDNPFPGNSVDVRDNTQINNKWNARTNYSAGQSPYSNTQSTSRYPGENWSSAVVVQDEILNARGAKGDKLYEKSPLYTITLTPSQMKKIRDYNKNPNNPLSDFKLTCARGTDYCYSAFLHGNTEDCKNNKCLTIDTDTQKSICVNIKEKNITDFINCYESKN